MTTIVSALNSATTSLASGATYTGASEPASGYSTVAVTLRGNAVVAGTLLIGFSSDGSTWSETSFSVADPTSYPAVTVRAGFAYYRVRYVNGSGTQSSFRIQSVFAINPTAGSQGPPGVDGIQGPPGPAGPAGPATVTEIRQLITLSSGNIVSKSFAIASTPLVPANLKLFLEGGPKAVYSRDFSVSGTTVSWSGLGLEGFLEAGEQVEVYYFV